MNYDIDLKFIGDAYPGGFSNGLSMYRSKTREGFARKESDASADTVTFENGLGITAVLNIKKDGECDRVSTTVKNGSEVPVTLERLASAALCGVKAEKIHRLRSFWSAEGKLRSETIEELHLEPSWNRCGERIEKFGTCGSMPVRGYFPFVALEDTEAGTFTALQIYCPSSWQIELLCKESDALDVSAGLADRDFGHWMKTLKPGEEFTSPEVVVAHGESLYEVCHKLVNAQHPAISPADGSMGILFNEYCTTWGNPSYENVKKICDKISGHGIDFLVIDSGWYGNDTWWNSIGDWIVNENRFPGGMKPIADYIRSKGMIPGLWFELEALAWESKYYNNPDLLLKKDGYILTGAGRRFWDMENPAVVAMLKEKIIDLLKNSGFGYVKIDYNDTLGIGVDGCESLGEGLRRKVAASQDFFRLIAKEIPGIVIENCSSGGHRLEPSMMSLCSQASFSDAHETTAIPIIAANLHRVIRPEQSQIWAVMRASDSDERLYYSLAATLLGRMCLSGDIYNLSGHQWEIIDNAIEFYKKVSEIIRSGMTTLIEQSGNGGSTSYNNPKGQQVVVRSFGKMSLCILHRFEGSSMEMPEFLNGRKIIAQFGKADKDFSAQAWLYE